MIKSIYKLSLLSCLLLPGLGFADDSKDHDAAKHLKDMGEIVSLESLLTDVRARNSGRVLQIELEFERDRYVYEIEMVDENGKVHEYFYDAKDGRFLWDEGVEGEKSK